MPRIFARLLAVTVIALFALVSARLIARDHRFVGLVAVVGLLFAVPAWIARRRMRRLLLSGDVGLILGTWRGSQERDAGQGELMTPLVTATAYAAYGFIEPARAALARASHGPAWEAAAPQRLFVEALLDVYEGDREQAIQKAETLERLPLPNVGFWMKRKISLLRRGVAALARAFAHASRASDEAVLARASRSSPLVHWAMRYARAIALVDAGRKDEARTLLTGAPAWPAESAFRLFHDELAAQI
jgi:hypothetical protein